MVSFKKIVSFYKENVVFIKKIGSIFSLFYSVSLVFFQMLTSNFFIYHCEKDPLDQRNSEKCRKNTFFGNFISFYV